MLSWSIFTFLIHASYDCNLRAYLLRVDTEPVVETAKDMYDQNRKYFTIYDITVVALMEDLPEETFHYIKVKVKETYENEYFFDVLYDDDGFLVNDFDQVHVINTLAMILC